VIRVPLTEDSLRAAFGRIADFKAVHHGDEDVSEPFQILSESLGVTPELTETLYELSDELFVEDVTDDHLLVGVLFGLMLGLIASDHASED
jgi:hypothetical protein